MFFHIRKNILLLSCLTALIFFFIGCGGSQQATEEDIMQQDQSVIAQDTTVILTDVSVDTAQYTYTTPSEPTREEMLQKELDEIKTENVQLKQQLYSAEQSQRDLEARMAELEAMKKESYKTPKSHSYSYSEAVSSEEQIAQYEAAVETAKARDFDVAIEQFTTLLDGGIGSDYSDNCNYWIGLCFYSKNKFKDAIDYFREVLKYKVSEKKDDAQFMIAQAYEHWGNKEKAQAEYKKLVEAYPNSEYIPRAKAKMN